jgi:1-deoxy-D-xylulose-5-phosphate reductoisomerase
MKRIAILGSTGSIGKSALDVIRNLGARFRVAGLSTNSNTAVLEKQIKEFHPEFVCVNEPSAARELKPRLNGKVKFLSGEEGLIKLAQNKEIDAILLAISGSGALVPLLKAIDCGKRIALANKEALVMAGPLIMKMATRRKAKIIPIDSEQSAIWQCLEGERTSALKNIYLTASGGPLRKMSRKEIKNISIGKVLRHPRWKMGRKISVDSASLMNKGLELLEAMFLFGVTSDKVKILIHPEAVIHSMVEFVDGSVLAQLSPTDMRIPIQYALTYPDRLPSPLGGMDFCTLGELHFQRPDFGKFPCLGLAYRAASELGTAPCILNAANEVGVSEFLRGTLRFIEIPGVIEKVMDRHHNKQSPTLRDIREADAWARREALQIINNLN